MKKLLTLSLLIFGIFYGTSQRIVEKTLKSPKNQDVFMNFKFASDIKVEQWNENNIKIKAEVIIDDGEGNSHFSIKSSQTRNRLKIYSDFGNYYKNKQSRNWKKYNRTTRINYTIFVPKNTNLEIKSISGSVIANEYNGNLTTDLISGDVKIKKYQGELHLKTISGDLDVSIENALVNAKTLSGTIYSNLEIDLDMTSKKSNVHNVISGKVNNGGKTIKFETISGNIYLRKI